MHNLFTCIQKVIIRTNNMSVLQVYFLCLILSTLTLLFLSDSIKIYWSRKGLGRFCHGSLSRMVAQMTMLEQFLQVCQCRILDLWFQYLEEHIGGSWWVNIYLSHCYYFLRKQVISSFFSSLLFLSVMSFVLWLNCFFAISVHLSSWFAI